MNKKFTVTLMLETIQAALELFKDGAHNTLSGSEFHLLTTRFGKKVCPAVVRKISFFK